MTNPEEVPIPSEAWQSEKEHYEEIILSEADEWTKLLDQASDIKEKHKIVEAILRLARLEQLGVKYSSDFGKVKEVHKTVNSIRVSFGLPPKYTDAVD